MENTNDSANNSPAADVEWPKLAFRTPTYPGDRYNLLMFGILLISFVLVIFVLINRNSLPSVPTLSILSIFVVISMIILRILMLRQVGAKHAGILLASDRLIEHNAAQQVRAFTYDQINLVRPYYRGGVEIHYYPIASDGKIHYDEIRETYLIPTANRIILVQELRRRIVGPQPTQVVNRRYLHRQGMPILAFFGSALLMLIAIGVFSVLLTINPDLIKGPVGAIFIVLVFGSASGLAAGPVAAELYINRYGGVPIPKKKRLK
jgi:hypothetical protein